MISFDHFVLDDASPIYLQLVQYLKRGIVGGTVIDGDELPSRRVLSALLGVNPNTVQKAYRILEDEGLIRSRTGAKSCVSVTAETSRRLRGELLREDVRPLVRALKETGVSREEAVGLIEVMWGEEE